MEEKKERRMKEETDYKYMTRPLAGLIGGGDVGGKEKKGLRNRRRVPDRRDCRDEALQGWAAEEYGGWIRCQLR